MDPVSINSTNTNDLSFSTYLTGNLLTNSMTMMVMMPLMTTMSTKIVDFVITVLQIFGRFIIYLFSKLKNRYWKNDEYIIEIEIFDMSNAVLNLTNCGKAIIWYLKQNNLNVSRKYMFLWNDILKNAQDHDDANKKLSKDNYLDNEMCLFMPIPVEYKKK